MSSLDPTMTQGLDGRSSTVMRLALPVFALGIFVSAFLLFSVQPLFTKMVLPKLGGAPGVWSVAMVFFQAVLLLGYLYAHGLTRWLAPRHAVAVHLALIVLVASLALPIGLAPGWGRPPVEGEAFWLLGLFAVSVGLPFFAVSANGPLLQAWFARTGHGAATDPYFLYGASNLGSFMALIAYPFVIEPLLPLNMQSGFWSLGFAGLGAIIALCGAMLLASPREAAAKAPPLASVRVGWGERAAWIGLSAVPSGLLVAVTAHVTTDVAAVPLLWVVPLAIFLLTFVLAFRDGAEKLHATMLAVQPALLAVLLISHVLGATVPWLLAAALHIGFFFVATMVCHGELYRRRPPVARLTEFYVLLSLGGVIGGAFASLVAPVLFSSLLEYPILLVATVLCRPGVMKGLAALGATRLLLAVLALVAFTLSPVVLKDTLAAVPVWAFLIAVLLLGGLTALSRERPVALMMSTALLAATAQKPDALNPPLARERSFFAVHEVTETASGNGRFLVHGTTVHGAERVRNADGSPVRDRPEPVSYFYRGGPYSEAIEAVRTLRGGRIGRVAVVGLGMGSLACHARPGEEWVFFEIDPVVVKIAQDQRLFRSLSACTPGARVVTGDGRLTLADEPQPYDLIILDAFSSNAVPVHLLTAEALAGYGAKLTPDGALLFNITNRSMELASVVAASAKANDMVTAAKADRNPIGDPDVTLLAKAEVAIVARSPRALGQLADDPNWRRVEAPASVRTWTDDYSNVVDAIRRRVLEP
ncbi:fused MFS/spermidine synthase [Phreatobacter oligotrophus]|uniref:Spermidine synthase n=1 Tax=Phreatobacter oligotrophus TaxID=1122261 RepID=A0A2T4Z2L9_9HYPH|nr:fused MFS/spermidine synthase [Phreatobacter oligotrophus]PTM55026.1 hypothetical protein C8P69_105176 [Phreatobacter oligotrophus]